MLQKEGKGLKKQMSMEGRKNLFIFLMLCPSILMVIVFVYYPVLRGLPMAFQKYSLWELNNIYWVGFDNFKKLFAEPLFLQTLPNTLKWVFFSLILQFVIGMSIALMIKNKFKGRGLYQGSIFFPWAVSGFLIGILWRWLYNGNYGVINDMLIKLGLVDVANPVGFLSDPNIAIWSTILANVWYGIAFFAIMIQAALQGVPDELYEAAEVDGATKFYQFYHITIPFIKPILILTTLLRAIWIFNFPQLIYALTRGGPGGSTEIMTTYMLNLIMFGTDYGRAAAMGIMLMVVMVIYTTIYLFVTRFNKDGDE